MAIRRSTILAVFGLMLLAIATHVAVLTALGTVRPSRAQVQKKTLHRIQEKVIHADSPRPNTLRVIGFVYQDTESFDLRAVPRVRVFRGRMPKRGAIVYDRRYDDLPIRTDRGESRVQFFEEEIPLSLPPGDYLVQFFLVHETLTARDVSEQLPFDQPGGDLMISLKTLPPVTIR